MEGSAMADVRKVDFVTFLVTASIAANFWVTALIEKTGGTEIAATELDLGEMLGEDGVLAAAARLLSFLPFM